jgi:hypothetical protein
VTAPTKVGWRQAIAWRLDRHHLASIDGGTPEDVVRRLCGVQAQVASSADLAIRLRQATPASGAVAKAIAQGSLLKTWSVRATLHLLTPQEAGRYLSLMASTRWWERPIWVRHTHITPQQMEELRGIIREILGRDAVTREDLIRQVTARNGFDHVGEALRSSWGSVFKPFAWQGDIVFGPSVGNRVTFMTPEAASKQWSGVPNVEDAWPLALLDYLGAYGPATPDHFSAWLMRGTLPKRRLKSWFDQMEADGRIVTVDVEGQPAYARTQDADDLGRAKPSSELRLLGGFDQWVLGPGTDDGRVVPAARRSAVSRTAGWISPVVIAGGVVSGTWEMQRDELTVTWFNEAGKPPTRQSEARRLAAVLGQDLKVRVEVSNG